MQLIQGDPLEAERRETGFARGGEVTGAAVRHPAALRACQSAFSGHEHARAIDRARQGRRDQPLVMIDVGIVAAVGVGGIEQGDARIERRPKHGDCRLVVAIGVGRQPHAAHRDWTRRG